ncbi:MAG: pantoate--beta-alanine ligase [Pseudomonadota bacterium]
MQILHSTAELRLWKAAQPDCAFVATMGNLHEGHISLVEQARLTGLPVIASIFVNPLQFGAGEDFERYPRTFDADCEKLRAAGCAAVFAPALEDMYPQPQSYFVEPPAMANELCGKFRPGHFRGVLTVVLKLFNLVEPRTAVFGRKDYQQLALIRGMVKQLNLPIEIRAGETVRAEDGLALSSRNGYLSDTERREAPRLYQQLKLIADALALGRRDFEELEVQALDALYQHGWKVDYVSIRRPDLSLPAGTDANFVVLGAAWLGRTRLIDNVDSEGGREKGEG